MRTQCECVDSQSHPARSRLCSGANGQGWSAVIPYSLLAALDLREVHFPLRIVLRPPVRRERGPDPETAAADIRDRINAVRYLGSRSDRLLEKSSTDPALWVRLPGGIK